MTDPQNYIGGDPLYIPRSQSKAIIPIDRRPNPRPAADTSYSGGQDTASQQQPTVRRAELVQMPPGYAQRTTNYAAPENYYAYGQPGATYGVNQMGPSGSWATRSQAPVQAQVNYQQQTPAPAAPGARRQQATGVDNKLVYSAGPNTPHPEPVNYLADRPVWSGGPNVPHPEATAPYLTPGQTPSGKTGLTSGPTGGKIGIYGQALPVDPRTLPNANKRGVDMAPAQPAQPSGNQTAPDQTKNPFLPYQSSSAEPAVQGQGDSYDNPLVVPPGTTNRQFASLNIPPGKWVQSEDGQVWQV